MPARWRRVLGRFDFADVLLCAIPLLCVFALRNNDLWWHLAAGRAMFERHAFLHGDPFSFTGFMGDWVDNAWLSQLGYYVTWRLGGNFGLIVFRCCLYALIFFVIRSLLRAGRRPAALLPCLVVGIALSYGWWELRPSAFSMLGTLLVLRILEEVRRSNRGFAALPIVFLLWASAHPGFLFGLCLLVATVAALYVEPLVPHWPRWTGEANVSPRLAAWTGVSILATLVNPYGWRVYSEQLSITGNVAFRAALDEWVPPSVPFLALVFLTVGAFALFRYRRVSLAGWVPILAAAGLSTTGVRFEEYFALVAVPMIFVHSGPGRLERARRLFVPALLAGAIVIGLQSPLAVSLREGQPGRQRSDAVEQRLEERIHRNALLLSGFLAVALAAAALRGREGGRWLLLRSCGRAGAFALAPAVACAALLAMIAPRAGRIPPDYVETDRYPDRCLPALTGENRRVFNRLSWGGWLIWNARLQTFIDGRGWGQPLYLDYLRCYGPDRKDVFATYRIDTVVVPHGDTIAADLARQPDWKLACTDGAAVVYERRAD
jgi:hypothetical protein